MDKKIQEGEAVWLGDSGTVPILGNRVSGWRCADKKQVNNS